MPRFHRLSLELPHEQEEWIVAELWALGSIGMESRQGERGARLEAYFEAPLPSALRVVPRGWPERRIRLVASSELPDTDWLAEHRASVQPLEIGRGWLVDAGEPGERTASARGRTTLRIPARRAFGTGSHESTRLALEWLEEIPVEGLRVLDLGTGSGILSIAAVQLGASRVLGLDRDPVAVLVAMENLRLNRVELALVAGELRCLSRGSFDLALVNILPSEWIARAPGLRALLTAESDAIFSGVPRSESKQVVHALGAAGFEVEGERRAGDWVALHASIRS